MGRHLAEFLIDGGCDVRDVPPHRATRRRRGRHEGKSDTIDACRVAREAQANPQLACAFKQATPAAIDPVREQMALWHNARKSLTKVRVQLLGEIDMLIHELPERLRTPITGAKTMRAKINAFTKASWDPDTEMPAVGLRLRLIAARIDMLQAVLDQDKTATAALSELVASSGSTLTELVGIAPRAAAEILIETGDIDRFTESRVRPLHRHRPSARILWRRTQPAHPTPPFQRRQPQAQRSHPPHRHDPTPLRATRPAPSSTTPSPEATHDEKPCESSNATSPASSTAPCCATPDTPKS